MWNHQPHNQKLTESWASRRYSIQEAPTTKPGITSTERHRTKNVENVYEELEPVTYSMQTLDIKIKVTSGVMKESESEFEADHIHLSPTMERAGESHETCDSSNNSSATGDNLVMMDDYPFKKKNDLDSDPSQMMIKATKTKQT